MTNTADQRIAYGARCTWWDSITKAGRVGKVVGGLPCCPHCGGVLFEVESERLWWEQVDRYAKTTAEGYREFMAWARGKCFRNYDTAAEQYQQQRDS